MEKPSALQDGPPELGYLVCTVLYPLTTSPMLLEQQSAELSQAYQCKCSAMDPSQSNSSGQVGEQ